MASAEERQKMSRMTAAEREAYCEQQRLEKLAEKETKKKEQKKMRENEALKKKEELRKVRCYVT